MIEALELLFREATAYIALGVEALAVACVAIGSIDAVLAIVRHWRTPDRSLGGRRDIWLNFAGWILISLEFALGADVIRTAIAPSWDDVGKLGAIAAIRTALSYFLSRDIETAIEPASPAEAS